MDEFQQPGVPRADDPKAGDVAAMDLGPEFEAAIREIVESLVLTLGVTQKPALQVNADAPRLETMPALGHA